MPRTKTLAAQLFRLLAVVLLACGPALSAAAQDTASQDPQAALAQLIEVLRDDTAREALIAELETGLARAGDAPPEADDEAVEAEPEPEAQPIPSAELRSLGARIADFTRSSVEDITGNLATLWRQLSNVPRIFAGLDIGELDALWGMAGGLAALALVTYGGLLALRRLGLQTRLKLRTAFAKGGWVAKPVTLLLEFVLDAVAVLIPYAIGYGVAVGVLGGLSLEYALYLNAFVMVEIAMAVIRSVLSPKEPEQRLLHVSDGAARAIMAWSRLLIGLFIFGQLMVMPLVNANVSFATGRAVSLVLILVFLAAAAVAVLVARRPVRNRLMRMIARPEARQDLAGPLGWWHVFALGYLAILAIVALTRTSAQFQAILWSNVQIALAVLAGAIALNIIKRVLSGGIALPHNIHYGPAALQRQIEGIAPTVLRGLRIIVVFAVIVFCLAQLGLFDFGAFLETETGGRIAGSTLAIGLILGIAVLAWIGVNAWVDGRIDPERGPAMTARRRTLFILMRNALTIAIISVTAMLVLSEIGINIAPLLASAGVIGLAVGFGAQRLVQDIITGIFIQLEGAIDVGDVVSVAGISGVVERMTIRSVSLRDAEGSYHVIPFSTVAAVTNFMRGFSYAVVDVTVPYRENVEDVKAAMFAAFETLRTDPQQGRYVVGSLEWDGVNTLSLTDVVLRARIKTGPGRQWGVKRRYNRLLKDALQARFIGVPEAERPAVREPEPPQPPEPEKAKGDEEIALPDPDAGPDSTAS